MNLWQLVVVQPAISSSSAHRRAFDFHGVILLRLGPEVVEVVGGEIDAAHERALAIDHQELAMQPAEHVHSHPQQRAVRVERAKPHAGIGQRRDEAGREARRAVAVHGEVDAHAARRGLDQMTLQCQPDLVLEQDEGFDQHLASCAGDRLEYAREEGLAVLEEPQRAAGAWRIHAAYHSIRASSGAWSDRCDHGRPARTRGSCVVALRT